MSQKFTRWQPVEVYSFDNEEWNEGRYICPAPAKSLADHYVFYVSPLDGSTVEAGVTDLHIRPLPRFEATGDELPLLAGLLAEVEQRMVNTDMSNTNTIGPEAAAVNAMLRRCWAAMGGRR